MNNLLIGTIRIYQHTLGGKRGLLALIVGGGCKHSPTCSEYAIKQIREIGVLRGVFLGTKRVLRCF